MTHSDVFCEVILYRSLTSFQREKLEDYKLQITDHASGKIHSFVWRMTTKR